MVMARSTAFNRQSKIRNQGVRNHVTLFRYRNGHPLPPGNQNEMSEAAAH
jgi:hypothetical protein